MAFALLVAGLVLLVAGVRNTQGDLFTLLKGDVANKNGQPGFIYWIAAIFLIGAIGYIPKVKPFSVALLSLVILVLFLTKGVGFFSQLQGGIASTAVQPTSATSSTPGSTPASSVGLPAIPSLPSFGTLLQNSGG